MTIMQETERGGRAAGGAPSTDDAIVMAVKGAQLPIVISDARRFDQPIVFANRAFLALTGYEEAEVVGRNCRFLQGPETGAEAVETIRRALEDGGPVGVELVNYRKDGSRFWNALHISPVRDPAGEVAYFLGSQRDVTASREAELELKGRVEKALEQKTALLHEIDHRVKNNLQLISSLLLLQSRRSDDEGTRAALRRTLERVTAVATVHRRLFQGEAIDRFDFAEFVRDLVSDLTGAAGRPDLRVLLDLEPVEVGASQAAPLALILSELVTNALRHARPDGAPATLHVALIRGERSFDMVVEDDGVGRPGEAPAAGFGLTIAGLLAQQLRADIRLEDAGPGLKATVRCPVSLVV
ncbi:histidine kinase dimerization/phosphoacceptor domain -containing protein [Phenylobacterium terrae]|uniref:Histidine kinase dimerization/phosphoacceptor domain -containing protein n=1 Tax=Phenylobacterium terrae TaxID=2665495 RepID=A0ABW4N405_9CAUL